MSEIIIDNPVASYSDNWPLSTAAAGFEGANYQYHAGETAGLGNLSVPIDNTQATLTGTWPNSTGVAGYHGSNYQYHASGTGQNTATWALKVTTTASYDVYATWTAHVNRASDAPYTINHTGGSDTVTVNQQTNGGQWQLLGTYTLDTNSHVSLSDNANGYVIADAVAALPAGTPLTPATQGQTATWAINQSGEHAVYAKWSASANRASDAQYTVDHANGSTTITVNQQSNGGQWQLLGTYTLDQNSQVSLSSAANGYVIADAIKLVATAAPAPTGSTLYYSHNDHLGTPQVFTDQNQSVVWQSDYQPFGEVNESVTTFANNLRFAGQYFDEETGLHYNYFRDYDPTTGRYVQSDPIGLSGGLIPMGIAI